MAILIASESSRLLDAICHTRVYGPVLIALAIGMRRGEVLALRWWHVDLDSGTLWVVGSFQRTRAGLRAKAPESEKARAVTLPAFAANELRRLKREQAEELLKLGMRQDGDTLLCPRADGEPMHVARVDPARRPRHGRSRVRFHDLRHSQATQPLLAGLHPKVAKERLGRWKIRVTLDLHSHVSATMQADTAARMEVAFQVLKSATAASADSVW